MAHLPAAGEDARRQLAEALDEVLGLVEQAVAGGTADPVHDALHSDLLQQCLALSRTPEGGVEEPVRTVHHLACSGGTLISRCIGALPNVQLLSEVDPLATLPGQAGKPRFAPTDMVTLLRQSTRGTTPSLLIELFHAELKVVHADARARGQHLVLRDHAHTQFCRNDQDIGQRPDLRRIVAAAFPVRSVVTVRHPVDSFASLQANGWVQFTPATFDEYCRRYGLFLDAMGDTPVVRYEDFLQAPQAVMAQICSDLGLPFDPGFEQLFPTLVLSGDSGRSGAVLEARPRRPEAIALFEQEAPHFRAVATRLGYELGHNTT